MTDDSSKRQRKAPYPANFVLAVKPEDVYPSDCDHDAGICACAHDWRIHWGNVAKRSKRRNVFVTDAP